MMFTKQAAKLLLLLWEAVSAFIVQNDNTCRVATSWNQKEHDDIFTKPLMLDECWSRRRRRFGASNNIVDLYAAPKAKVSTDERRKRRLQQDGNAQLPNSTRERTVVIMYHKPPNVITSHSNADEVSQSAKSSQNGQASRRTVYEDILSMTGFVSDRQEDANESFEVATKIRSKLHAIGRLDADTTGLLLLTNDGALVHQITNPNAKTEQSSSGTSLVQKTYEAVIMGHHSLPGSSQQSSSINNTLTSNTTSIDSYPLQELLDKGVALSAKHGGHTKPADALSILSHPSRSTTHVSITISEGKNRQIRRMFHAVGSGVMKLHRVSIGKLTLNGLLEHLNDAGQGQMSDDSDSLSEGLQEGEWRLLSNDEIKKGLGWKCRDLDDFSANAHGGRINGGRNGNRQRRKTPGRGVRGKRR